MPCDDDSAGLPEYAHTVVKAIGDRDDVVVVAQSFGGFTAPLVADQVPAPALVLVTGMLPAPGESPDDWVANTGFDRVMREQTQQDVFYHDMSSTTTCRATWPTRHAARHASSRPLLGTAHGR